MRAVPSDVHEFTRICARRTMPLGAGTIFLWEGLRLNPSQKPAATHGAANRKRGRERLCRVWECTGTARRVCAHSGVPWLLTTATHAAAATRLVTPSRETDRKPCQTVSNTLVETATRFKMKANASRTSRCRATPELLSARSPRSLQTQRNRLAVHHDQRHCSGLLPPLLLNPVAALRVHTEVRQALREH